MSFVRRKPLVSIPPQPTVIGVLTAAVDAANARMRAFGRTEWDDRDTKLAADLLCAALRKMSAPWPGVADGMAREQK